MTPKSPALPVPNAIQQKRKRFVVRSVSPAMVTVLVGALALVCIGLYLFLGLDANAAYVLPRRVNRVLTMVLVAFCVGVSTVLFQTVTSNRILTPSIMGFDSLFMLIQTVLIFVIGTVGRTQLGTYPLFMLELGLMVLFAAIMYRWLFTGSGLSLHLVLLIGIVFGTLFRGISSLLQRLLDPSEFMVLQDSMFASFTGVDLGLLRISVAIIAAATIPLIVMRRRFDVLSLGRDTAISLGINHTRTVTTVLIVCSIFVGVCTALVGPITFFGLIVANLAYALCRTFRHTWILPIAVLLGIVALVGGQLILERVFAFDTALSIVIEFCGGLLFLFLLLRGSIK